MLEFLTFFIIDSTEESGKMITLSNWRISVLRARIWVNLKIWFVLSSSWSVWCLDYLKYKFNVNKKPI